MIAIPRTEVPKHLKDNYGIDVPLTTLDYWYRTNKGPAFHQIEGRRVYYVSDLKEWFQATRVEPGGSATNPAEDTPDADQPTG